MLALWNLLGSTGIVYINKELIKNNQVTTAKKEK